jgi:hypothetical protein
MVCTGKQLPLSRPFNFQPIAFLGVTFWQVFAGGLRRLWIFFKIVRIAGRQSGNGVAARSWARNPEYSGAS